MWLGPSLGGQPAGKGPGGALAAADPRARYCLRNKTDTADCLRGFCREFGLPIAVGARTGLRAISQLVADPASAIPALLRPAMALVPQEVLELERRIGQLERELTEVARHSNACQLLLSISGVGLLTATALVAAIGTDIGRFANGRQLAAWIGLTPREHSSGQTRRLGSITRAGDRYLRTLLTHGARSVLQAASRAQSAGRTCEGLRGWALAVRQRSNANKATCALANKLARICFATLRHQQHFDEQRATKARAA